MTALIAAVLVAFQVPTVQLPPAGSSWINLKGAPPILGKQPILFISWSSTSSVSRTMLGEIGRLAASWPDSVRVVAAHSEEFEGFGERESVEACAERWGVKVPILMDEGGAYSSQLSGGGPDRAAVYDGSGKMLARGSLPESWPKIAASLASLSVPATTFSGAAPTADGTRDLLGARQTFDEGRFGYSAYGRGEPQYFILPEELNLGSLYLEGIWKLEDDGIELKATEGSVAVRFNGTTASIVLDTEARETEEEREREEKEREREEYKAPPRASHFEIASVLLDGKPLAADQAGRDVKLIGGKWTSTIHGPSLIEVVRLPAAGTHTLRILMKGCGVRFLKLAFSNPSIQS